MTEPAPTLSPPNDRSDLPPLAGVSIAAIVPKSVAAQARLHPDNLALSAETEALTFAELERRASQLAHHLRALGAGPETVVGLCVERSPQFVVAALAIMKTGAAYLPMDSAHPAERLRFVLQDAGARLLVTQGSLAGHFTGCAGVRIVALDTEEAAIGAQSPEPPEVEIAPDSLAYIIYTSGSTGQPKGVEITHRALANLVTWHIRAFGVTASDSVSFGAGVGFDAAVWELWPALSVGAAVCLPDEATRLSHEASREWLIAQRITISFAPPALAEPMIASAAPWPADTALRFLLTGADTLHRRPVIGLPFALVNNYGPTECTVVATSGVVAPGDNENSDSLPSIGSPIDDVLIRIDADGEILIGGAGVARGYRNRPDLTAERFVTDEQGARWYRTGDTGRWLPNGEIAFLGRRDDQVKIRGFRIELGEINARLQAQPSIAGSVVIAREDIPGDKQLVAYIVSSAGSAQDEAALREAVRQSLPDYMEPAAFVWLESLPLTPNGKVDRAALPPPKPHAEKDESDAGFIPPQTPTEETLAAIMTDVLDVPRISTDDDFFHLGAHSLLGAQVIARVRSAFGVELRLLDVFDAPTVAELAAKIEETLTSQLAAMSDVEVEAALAAMNNADRETTATFSHR